MSAPTDFASIIGPVAAQLYGEPNKRLSSKSELRFGTNGSLSVHVEGNQRGTWYDHEAKSGGGTLALVAHKIGGDAASAAVWCAERFPDVVPKSATSRREVAAYPYVDQHARIVFEVVRFEPKDFRQRRPDGRGGHIWNLKGITPVIYRMPDVIAGIAAGKRVYIVEGEKDADKLAGLGLVATCNPGGAGKWTTALNPALAGADVTILPDNDDAGREHGESVARALQGIASSVRVVELGLVDRKADVSDWIDQGGGREELEAIADAAPPWRPTFRPRFPIVWFGREDEHKPLAWIVRGLLVDGGVSAVFGAPKSTKTFFALDLALHVAHGRDWYGQRVKSGGVVYVCGEGAAGARLRMKAWANEKAGDCRAPFVLVPQSINLFDDEDELHSLVADIRGLADPMGEPVRLVVLDTLSRMIGSGDEDKARDINVVVRSAEHIQRETGAHVMIVHHSGKDRDRGMRGSNALLGAVDVAIEVTKEDTGACQAKVTAIKDGSDIGPFRYTLRQSVVGEDEEGDEIVSCVLDPADASQGGETVQRRLSEAERKAESILFELSRDIGTKRDNIWFVPIGTWRDTMIARFTGTPDAKKRAANRAIKSLTEKGIVDSANGMAWLDEAMP